MYILSKPEDLDPTRLPRMAVVTGVTSTTGFEVLFHVFKTTVLWARNFYLGQEFHAWQTRETCVVVLFCALRRKPVCTYPDVHL